MISAENHRVPEPAEESTAYPGVRVTLIGGSRLSRAGIRVLMERQPGISVMGDGDTPADVSDADAETDVVVLDIDERADTVLDAIQHIQREHGTARILIVANRCDSEASRRFVLAGAGGVVLKDKSPEHLLQAIRKVHEGELWVDRATVASLISGMASGRREAVADPERLKIESLTHRERQVIALIANGMTNKAIAENMKISDNTVRHHLTSIFEKLGTHDRLSLLIYAYRHKLALPQT